MLPFWVLEWDSPTGPGEWIVWKDGARGEVGKGRKETFPEHFFLLGEVSYFSKVVLRS